MKQISKKELYNPLVDMGNNIFAISWNYNDYDDINGIWDTITINSNGKPSAQTIVNHIYDEINKIVKYVITNKFIWKGKNVKLSVSDQLNYKSIYDVINKEPEALMPITVVMIENNKQLFYEFTSVDEYNDFYISSIKHISQALKDSWEIKKNVNIEDYK